MHNNSSSMKKRKLQSSSPFVVTHADTKDQLSTPGIPDQVIAFNIFIRLPLRQLVQLRTLSKSMNELLNCKSLLEAWRSTSDFWLLMARILPSTTPKLVSSPLVAYNILDNDVHDMFFPMPLHKSLVPSLISSFMHSLSEVQKTARVHLVASAGGLICAVITGRLGTVDDYSLLVFNPLTGCRKTLPNPPEETMPCFDRAYSPSFTLTIVTQSNTNGQQTSYYVVLQDQGFRLNIYNSVTKKWTCAALNEISSFRDIRKADVIFDADTDEDNVILGYNIVRDEWYEEYVSKPWDEDLDDEICYIRYKGQIYMVGGPTPTTGPMTRGRTTRLSQIFLLQPGTGWIKVTSLNPTYSYDEHSYQDARLNPDLFKTVIKAFGVKELRPQVRVGPSAASNTADSSGPRIGSKWLKFLFSPPPSLVALSLYVPSFSAKP